MRSSGIRDGLTEAEIAEAMDWVRRHVRHGVGGCERWCDYRGFAYLSVTDNSGEEIFLLGRQDGMCFADRQWEFSTLAEGETVEGVLKMLEPRFVAARARD